MKSVGPTLLLLAACTEPPAPPAPPAPAPPAPIDVDDCYAPDCPYVGALTVPIRDDDIAETMLPVAVNGIEQFGYETYGATRHTIVATGAWTQLDDDGAYVHLRGTSAGTGHFVVNAFTPYHDTEVVGHDQLDLDILPAATVSLDLPRYYPLDTPIAPVVLGTNVTMAARLLSADNRRLVDLSMTIDGASATQTNWNEYAALHLSAGHHEVTVTADSLAAPTTLAYDSIAHIDEIRTTDTHEPGATYYQLVCAHAFAGGREVFSEWNMSAAHANGWIPATAGNCLEVVPESDHPATVTFVAADGTTAHLDVTQ